MIAECAKCWVECDWSIFSEGNACLSRKDVLSLQWKRLCVWWSGSGIKKTTLRVPAFSLLINIKLFLFVFICIITTIIAPSTFKSTIARHPKKMLSHCCMLCWNVIAIQFLNSPSILAVHLSSWHPCQEADNVMAGAGISVKTTSPLPVHRCHRYLSPCLQSTCQKDAHSQRELLSPQSALC